MAEPITVHLPEREPDPFAISPIGTIRGDDAPGITFRPSADILTPRSTWSYDATPSHDVAHARAIAYGCAMGREHDTDEGCGGDLVTLGTPPVADGESCGIGWYLTAVCARHLPEMASRVSQSIGW